MTIVETMWPETRPRAELHDEVNRLSQERITAHAAMVELRNVGDLENNDDYHRAVRVVEMLDAQLVRVRSMLASSSDGWSIHSDDPGRAHEGSIVTVSFDDNVDDVTLIHVGDPTQEPFVGVETCSPDSPLGQAILGSSVGERHSYLLPDGTVSTITILECVQPS